MLTMSVTTTQVAKQLFAFLTGLALQIKPSIISTDMIICLLILLSLLLLYSTTLHIPQRYGVHRYIILAPPSHRLTACLFCG